MEIKDLSKPLSIFDIDFRIGMSKPNGCSILAYKDARVDMKRLDEVVGVMNWTNEYKRDSKGVLQCGVGIRIDYDSDFVWKWSNGTESFAESEKGEYSDAFKRAGFMWGIGRELYDFPFIWVNRIDGDRSDKNGKLLVNPNEWTWLWGKSGDVLYARDKNDNIRVKASR